MSEKETSHSSLDVTGIGKAMQSIPPSSWEKIVETACTTFEKIVSPLTETTHGVGRLIQAKFDRLIDAQKVLAVEVIETATHKAKLSTHTVKPPKPQILLQVIENSANETDETLRDLWSNLLAQEMTTQEIHPEVGRILSRLSSQDAQLLAQIAEEPTNFFAAFTKAIFKGIRVKPLFPMIIGDGDRMTFNQAHLRNLNLIDQYDRVWELTAFGEGFIKAVSDPSLTQNDATVELDS